MPHPFEQLRRLVLRVLELAVMLSVAVLVLDVLWGIFSRELAEIFDFSPSPWTEEVATNLLIWVSLLGAAVAYERSEHLGLDYVVKKFDLGLQRVMAIACELIVIGFATATFIYGGYVLVSKTLASGQVTPALGLKMGYVYLAVPVSGALILFFGLYHVMGLLWGIREPFPAPGHTPVDPPQVD